MKLLREHHGEMNSLKSAQIFCWLVCNSELSLYLNKHNLVMVCAVCALFFVLLLCVGPLPVQVCCIADKCLHVSNISSCHLSALMLRIMGLVIFIYLPTDCQVTCNQCWQLNYSACSDAEWSRWSGAVAVQSVLRSILFLPNQFQSCRKLSVYVASISLADRW